MAKRSSNTLHRKKRFSKDNAPIQLANSEEDSQVSKSKDANSSFWREFGVDTPHKQNEDTTNRIVSDPLLDLDDEAWEAWESPKQKSPKQKSPQRKDPPSVPTTTAFPESSERTPWPEVSKKFTPAKLTRTLSDMMKEWDAPIGNVERSAMREQAGQDHHVLTSPHM